MVLAQYAGPVMILRAVLMQVVPRRRPSISAVTYVSPQGHRKKPGCLEEIWETAIDVPDISIYRSLERPVLKAQSERSW